MSCDKLHQQITQLQQENRQLRHERDKARRWADAWKKKCKARYTLLERYFSLQSVKDEYKNKCALLEVRLREYEQ